MKKIKNNIIQFVLLFKSGGVKRMNFIRKHHVFKSVGHQGSYRPYLIPSDPEMIEFGDNVWISTNVRLLTHDMIGNMLNRSGEGYKFENATVGFIKIGNNVSICASVIILPNITIGNNVIVGAGAVVTKDIPDGEIWAGNPAHKIGNYSDFVNKRKK